MKRAIIIPVLIAALALTSCSKYLDINTDPNSPTEEQMTSAALMPTAEMNLAATYGDFLRIVGGYFSQHYAQLFGTSNYLDYSRFNMSATRSSNDYTQLTSRGLKNLKAIREKSAASAEWGTYLAATTLRAFIYQVLVDCYGEVPYTEALDDNNIAPHYDEGQKVYDGILAELDDALAKAKSGDKVTTNLLYSDDTAEPWIKFANALKLRILSRESGVKNVDDQIKDIIDENNLPDMDVAYTDCWGTASGEMSPFYAEEFATSWGSTQTNVVLNLALLRTMQLTDNLGNVTYEDPRLAVYFEPNKDSGEFTGALSGTNFSTSKSYKASYWCRPVASYDMPVYLITKFETEFFIAEYYARQNNSSEAASHYETAIKEAFSTADVEGVSAYLQQFPYDQSNYKKCIGIAKWVALSGVNTFEAWCELRRLDYPAFGTVKGSDMYDQQSDASYKPELYVAGTLYTPINVYGPVGENHVIERFPYAESSSARNGNTPEFPGYTTPVFWGK